MQADFGYYVELMIAQYRDGLAQLFLTSPDMNDFLLQRLEEEAEPIFREGAQRLIDSGQSDSPDARPILEYAVNRLLIAVQSQIKESTTSHSENLTRSGSFGVVHQALSRICPLFPFC